MTATLAGPYPATTEAWLTAWLLPEAEAMSVTGSRPAAVSGSVRENQFRVAAARLLYRFADWLVPEAATVSAVESASACHGTQTGR